MLILRAGVLLVTHQEGEIPVEVVGVEANWDSVTLIGPFPVDPLDVEWVGLIVGIQRPSSRREDQQ